MSRQRSFGLNLKKCLSATWPNSTRRAASRPPKIDPRQESDARSELTRDLPVESGECFLEFLQCFGSLVNIDHLIAPQRDIMER